MTWEDVLKLDTIEKGIMNIFRNMRLPRESRNALKIFKKGMAQVMRDIKQGGNVIILADPSKSTTYDNKVLVLGKDLLGENDPNQFIQSIKQQLEKNVSIKVTDSTSQTGPSITIEDASDFMY